MIAKVAQRDNNGKPVVLGLRLRRDDNNGGSAYALKCFDSFRLCAW
jgi:hypothetical protein